MDLRHYLQFKDFALGEYEHLFARTRWIKDRFKRYERYWPLEDRTLAMIFEKQSTRTRLSFEAGMHQLGGVVEHQFGTSADRPEPSNAPIKKPAKNFGGLRTTKGISATYPFVLRPWLAQMAAGPQRPQTARIDVP